MQKPLILVTGATGKTGGAVARGPGLLVVWLDRFQIRPEERAMSARFGSDYARYCKEVRRWL